MSETEKGKPNIVEPEILADNWREIESLKKDLDSKQAEFMQTAKANAELTGLLLESQAREMRLREALDSIHDSLLMVQDKSGVDQDGWADLAKGEIEVIKRILNQPAPPIEEILGKVEKIINSIHYQTYHVIFRQTQIDGHISSIRDDAEKALVALQSLRGKP